MTLTLTILTPERKIRLPELRHVVFQSPQGETGILPEHAACITLTSCGIVRAYRANARDSDPPQCFAVGNGSLRLDNNCLVLLVKRLCHEDELDGEATIKELDALNTRLSTLDPILDFETFNDCTRAAAFCGACLQLDREMAMRNPGRAFSNPSP